MKYPKVYIYILNTLTSLHTLIMASFMEFYETLDNGGNPFRVQIYAESKFVEVFKTEEQQIIHVFPYIRVWIGESPENEMTEFSGGYGEEFKGNSILLEVSKTTCNAPPTAKTTFEYIFIGDTIFSFQTESRIVDFISPVGNSSVPYPHAKDKKGRQYLMTEKIRVSGNIFEDPYKSWYGPEHERILPLSKDEHFNDVIDNVFCRYSKNGITGALANQKFPLYTQNGSPLRNINEVIAEVAAFNKRTGFEPFAGVKELTPRQ